MIWPVLEKEMSDAFIEMDGHGQQKPALCTNYQNMSQNYIEHWFF